MSMLNQAFLPLVKSTETPKCQCPRKAKRPKLTYRFSSSIGANGKPRCTQCGNQDDWYQHWCLHCDEALLIKYFGPLACKTCGLFK